ncbi:enoyl-CoA hydratase/isomerase family protein [Pseudarthrobacter scleromae]|uniref:enoyl-CoA hydratase/isomerase family protein n=1 Tax=Pseudarthrobacter scleromae TaxID=158897 RepID=UPI003638D0EF
MNLVNTSVEDGIYTLVLNSPETLNAMSYEMLNELKLALDAVRADKHSKALILTGCGRGFCSGAELSAMDSRMANDSFGAGVSHFMTSVCSPIVEAIQTMPVPVIGAVNGPAVGGGFGLALACHVVIAARTSYFSAPFVPKLGLIPDMGATWFLPRYVGRARALSLCLLGERLSAAGAVDMGLIYKCVDDEVLAEEAQSLARRLSEVPREAFVDLYEALSSAEKNSLGEQLHIEAERQGVLIELPAFREGVSKFLTKSS